MISRPLARAFAVWTRVAVGMGRVFSAVLGGLLFYVVITPVAVLTRCFGRDALRLRPVPRGASYWMERKPAGPDPVSMMRPF